MRRSILLLACGAALLSGCTSMGPLSTAPTPRDPATLSAAHAFGNVTLSPAAWPGERWWSAFGDPQLDALIDEALANAPTLAIADARARKAQAQAGVADAARLRVCGADRSWPVAMEAGYLELERTYLALPRSTPGTPWTVVLDAHIEDRAVGEGDALVPAVIVERLVAAADDQACVQPAAVPLAGTYWRALVLDGEPTVMVEGHEEPHLILRADDARYAATAGCNRLMGAWHSDGGRIEFSSGASTMMACWPPLDAQEMRLKQVLQDASRWRIDGQTLEFSDAGGRVIAVFEAVYLR